MGYSVDFDFLNADEKKTAKIFCIVIGTAELKSRIVSILKLSVIKNVLCWGRGLCFYFHRKQ